MDLSKDVIGLIFDQADPLTRYYLSRLNKKWNKVYRLRPDSGKIRPPSPDTFKEWYHSTYQIKGRYTNRMFIQLFLYRRLTPIQEWEFVQFMREYPNNPLFKCVLGMLPKKEMCILKQCGHCHGSRGLRGCFSGGYFNAT